MVFDAPSGDSPDVRWTHVDCALCGADQPREIIVDHVRRGGRCLDFHVVACGQCGFVYVTPRGAGQVFGNVAGGAARSDAAVANAPIYRRGLAQMRRRGLPASGQILDLGCARGDFLAFAAHRGHDVTGVDLNPRLAEDARGRGFEVHTGDLRDLSLPATFDAVTMWDVIEHVDDPVAVLDACRAAVRPGGLVFFHTGNARFQLAKARLLSALRPHGGPYLIPYQHVSHFDPPSARRAMAAAGLEPVSVFFAGTLHYRQSWKRWAMALANGLALVPARVGGPLATSAMGAIARRPEGG